MRKFKFFIDFEKEEKWLEEMAKKGYHLQNTTFGYKFIEGKSEQATIKIDFRKFKRNADFVDYCTMFADSGWKHLTGSKGSGIQYFKKTNDSIGDEIFSDHHSKAARYKRYSDMFISLAVSYLPLFIIFYLTDIVDFDAFINPKELYFTPGLWDKSGISFWFSFLFETPFALMRGFIWLVIPVTIISYLIFAYKSNKLFLENQQ